MEPSVGWIGERADESLTDGWTMTGASKESAKPGGLSRSRTWVAQDRVEISTSPILATTASRNSQRTENSSRIHGRNECLGHKWMAKDWHQQFWDAPLVSSNARQQSPLQRSDSFGGLPDRRRHGKRTPAAHCDGRECHRLDGEVLKVAA